MWSSTALRAASLLLLLTPPTPVDAFGVAAPRAPSLRPLAHRSPPTCPAAATAKRRAGDVSMVGGFGGNSFLNLGTPEVIVIGAVAWAILGPKELFKLAKQAGEFLGEFQQLGMQAKNTFTDALEAEMAEDDAAAATPPAPDFAADQQLAPLPPGWREATDPNSGRSYFISPEKETTWIRPEAVGPAPAPVGDMFDPDANDAFAAELAAKEADAAAADAFADDGMDMKITPASEVRERIGKEKAATVPSLAEMEARRSGAAGESLSAEQQATLRDSLKDSLGDPESNAANFAEQMSGARNKAVLDEYPAELSADDGVASGPMDGSPLDVTSAEDDLLQSQIAEMENELAMLRAEKKVIKLKRTAMEQNAERAKRMAEERKTVEAARAANE